MGDLVVGVGGILGVVEDDLIHCTFFSGNHQTLLVGIGHHAGDGDEGLGDHSLAVVGDGFFIGNRLTGLLVQILDGVGHGIFLNIPEGIDIGIVFLCGIDVNGQGVALDDGEVALLIVGIEFGAALGIEGLGDARQTGAGGGIGNFGIGVLNLIVDGVLLQDIGAPLAVDLQVLVDGHIGEVEGLLHAVLHVEPADEGVAAVGGFCGSGISLGTMGNSDSRMGLQLCSSLHCSLIQVEFHLVGLGNPLGIEDHIGGGHGHGAQFRLGTLIAVSRGVPAIEHIGVLFQIGRIFRHKMVFAQRRFILHATSLTIHIRIVVVEFQVVAVAGVAEVVVFFHAVSSTALFHFREGRIRPPLSETGNVVELFCIRQPTVLLNINLFV